MAAASGVMLTPVIAADKEMMFSMMAAMSGVVLAPEMVTKRTRVTVAARSGVEADAAIAEMRALVLVV
jgi:hypothetical protein